MKERCDDSAGLKVKRDMRRKTRRRKKRNTKRIWILSACMLFLFCLFTGGAVWLCLGEEKETNEEQVQKVKPLAIEISEPMITPNLDEVYSEAGIVVRLRDGKIMTQFGQDERIFPASLTKIMTCIIALEQIEDLEQTVVISPERYNELYVQEASMAGFLPGEEVSVIDLLYGSILPSGGECSTALAEHAAGSEEKFVELMNKKAEELGMKGTHYVNATGLHDERQYSTVKDISLLLQYALDNDIFREIFCSRAHSVLPTTQHLDGLIFQSSMFRLLDDWTLEEGEIKGGKTGYTDQAGLCLASMASIRGEEYIAVTAKAKGDHSTEPYHVYDAFTLYNLI